MHTAKVLALLSLCLLVGFALSPAADPPYQPKIAPASDGPAKSMKKIRVPKGLDISLFAAEPHLANPVAFCIDEKNRFYVAETFRLHHGVTDIRGHMNWLDDDLACRTVADRVAMYMKYAGQELRRLRAATTTASA